MMNSKWFKMAVLLLLLALAAPVQALAAEEAWAVIPFTVEYASGTVVMEALDGAPAPVQAEFPGEVEGEFAIRYVKPGNYVYRVYQKPGADENLEYDRTVYRVEVTVLRSDGNLNASVTTSIDGDAHKPDSVAFENVRRTGSLRIAKTVTGGAGDQNRVWHFTITLSEALSGTYGGVQFDGGVGHVSMKHGETVTVEGIPAGVDFEVAEDEAGKDGYTTTSEGEEGTILRDTAADVEFVNDKASVLSSIFGSSSSPQTGDETQLILWLVLAVVSLIAIVYVLWSRRKPR